MIEGLSHITLVVTDLDRTARLFSDIFEAEEVYDSGEKKHSLFKEKFFLIAGVWVAIMESEDIKNETYHHVAFKISNSEYEIYKKKLEAYDIRMRESRPRIEGEGRSLYFYDYDNNLFELHTGKLEERLDSYNKV
ncbi:FosX/FosE/FosI family fosfomycin resistance hydrolase [Alkalibacterium pelagium]|uniref:Catechol 2,3-dioxygenase n=1 Tax=Alkalibacterium pelagium TaxID=426702 RepID=A0A1H7G045_9LACT|nr:FosX/FosE/FosI family fosfomycin resistance hydrolase [Alkalibacterium pelagium]GEN49949.1 fosfomycin resistance protein FosX [Alkalibacterium pelagium]SEK31518.1 Catechol 2,3-dioxygenase [Alkalibacterium pelagium]